MEMDPKRNAEHYPDPTAYQAIRNAEPAYHIVTYIVVIPQSSDKRIYLRHSVRI